MKCFKVGFYFNSLTVFKISHLLDFQRDSLLYPKTVNYILTNCYALTVRPQSMCCTGRSGEAGISSKELIPISISQERWERVKQRTVYKPGVIVVATSCNSSLEVITNLFKPFQVQYQCITRLSTLIIPYLPG